MLDEIKEVSEWVENTKTVQEVVRQEKPVLVYRHLICGTTFNAPATDVPLRCPMCQTEPPAHELVGE